MAFITAATEVYGTRQLCERFCRNWSKTLISYGSGLIREEIITSSHEKASIQPSTNECVFECNDNMQSAGNVPSQCYWILVGVDVILTGSGTTWNNSRPPLSTIYIPTM